MMTITLKSLLPLAAAGAMLATSPAEAQYGASTYSQGTYNPVQAMINRNAMNAAIIRQSTGKKTSRTMRRSTVRRHR